MVELNEARVHAGDIITLSHLQDRPGRQSVQYAQVPLPFDLSIEVNASTMLAEINAWQEEKRPSLTVFLAQGAAKALRAFPLLNATFVSEDSLKLHSSVNIAIAVDSAAGLVFPVLEDVNNRPIADLETSLKALSEQASRGSLSSEDMHESTFSLHNLGMFGICDFRAPIYAPQTASLAVGTIDYRLVMTGNRIINLPVFKVKLSCDPRVIDMAMAAGFLAKLKDVLEE
ncbi:hypothetical protein CSB45_12500 [candidate division KSB3 bacterium]|uniref:2-oxoacid dehydrogenase acyltransferase catalytic domain-containing protein n=1 Tax=candidate division KSB3 bacterium TaxID=2044937 RepID=A0A2G6E361_9BACT|nr:MAG: hypothetical protein CSB45_12500 [candidate division KSB3 bacterium]PIE28714.1 MAG: hypothetical protein CSA57_12480 [candidate division KSB3 bacterium]